MANLTQTAEQVQAILNVTTLGAAGSGTGNLKLPTSGANTGPGVIDQSPHVNSDDSINTTLYVGFNINGAAWQRIDANDKALFWGLERHYLPTPGGDLWMEAYLQYQSGDGFAAPYMRPFMTVFNKTTDRILSTTLCGGTSGLVLSVNDYTGDAQQKVTGITQMTITKGNIAIASGRVQVGCAAPVLAALTGNILTVDGNTGAGILELATSAVDAAGIPAGWITFNHKNNTGAADKRVAQIYCETVGATATKRGADMLFSVKADNVNYPLEAMRLASNKKLGIGVTVPTAFLHLKASAAAANSASLKIDAGVVATTPVSGNIESDGTHLYWTDAAGSRKQLDN